VRLSQYTLEVLGCSYIEATGAVEASRRLWKNFPLQRSIIPMEYSTGIDPPCGGYLPLELVLLEPPNRCLERSGSILYIYGIDAVDSCRRIPQSCMEEYSNTTGLEGLVATSTGANRATDSNTLGGLVFWSSTVDSVEL